MTSSETGRTATRRAFLGAAVSSTAALAGCTSTTNYRIKSVEDSQYVEDASLTVIQDWTKEIADIKVALNQPETGKQISAVAIISPDGEQTDGQSVGTGENSVEVTARPVEEGEFTLAITHGGKVDCFGRFCSLTGGNVLEEVTVVISRA